MNYQNSPVLEQFPDHDILYLRFSSEAVARTEPVGNNGIVDYAEDGSVVGVELLAVSHGIDLTGLPEAGRIRGALSVLQDVEPAGPARPRGRAGPNRATTSARSRRAAHLRR